MPDARLQRTREAYPDDSPITMDEIINALPGLPPARWRMWTDEQGYTHRDRLPDVFTVAEPSDDDLWGV